MVKIAAIEAIRDFLPALLILQMSLTTVHLNLGFLQRGNVMLLYGSVHRALVIAGDA